MQEAFAAASSLTVEQRAIVKWAFEQLDKDGDGFISRQELDSELEAAGMNKAKRRQFLARLDENDDGCISYEEWIHFSTANPGAVEVWGRRMRGAKPPSFFQRIPAWVQIPAVLALFWLAGSLRQRLHP